MGSLEKELAKKRKKELKAQLKLEKKRRKAGHPNAIEAAQPAPSSISPPASTPATEEPDEKQLKEESVRINRWRLWATIVGVIVSAVGVAIRIYQLLSQ